MSDGSYAAVLANFDDKKYAWAPPSIAALAALKMGISGLTTLHLSSRRHRNLEVKLPYTWFKLSSGTSLQIYDILNKKVRLAFRKRIRTSASFSCFRRARQMDSLLSFPAIVLRLFQGRVQHHAHPPRVHLCDAEALRRLKHLLCTLPCLV
jgi:hypothetical protein